jgi:hypothetical protein
VRIVSTAALVLILGTLSSGSTLFTAAVARYAERSRHDFRTKEHIAAMLTDMEERLQSLASFDADYPDHPVLVDIMNAYAAQGLVISDVSSGIHLDFLPDSDLAQPALAAFLFATGTPDAFIAWRNAAGLSHTVDAWEPFLTSEGKDCCAAYGWVQVRLRDSFAFASVAASFGASDEASLFPLVNDQALINVNAVDRRLLQPLLKRAEWKIAAEKINNLERKLEAGPLAEGDVRATLGLPPEHLVYRYLGVKTQFWELRFTEAPYQVRAVAAALPDRNSPAVKAYQLIEWRLDRAS